MNLSHIGRRKHLFSPDPMLKLVESGKLSATG